jgi:hypothetical protein
VLRSSGVVFCFLPSEGFAEAASCSRSLVSFSSGFLAALLLASSFLATRAFCAYQRWL